MKENYKCRYVIKTMIYEIQIKIKYFKKEIIKQYKINYTIIETNHVR